MRTGKILTSICFLFLAVSALMGSVRAEESELPYNQTFGGDFRLPSSRGAELSLSDLQGQVVLMTFGYTSCPDVCPITMGQLDSVYKQLGEKADRVQLLFVSFDPERDNPEQLKQYLAFFDERYIGLTGTPEQIEQVADQYGVFYIRRDIGSAAGYTFAHSNHVYLLDQQGRLRRFYDLDSQSDELRRDIRYLVNGEQ